MNPLNHKLHVNTPQGPVALLPPPVELLRGLSQFLPFGLVGLSESQHGERFGLVMQCGERELYGLKQQSVEIPKDKDRLMLFVYDLLIAHSLAGYLANGFAGLLMPCAYLRPKGDRGTEVGFAYFGCPSAEGRESLEGPMNPAFDDRLGCGFTKMMTSFIAALGESSARTGSRVPPILGLEVRTRTQIGTLLFGFLVLGPHVVCLKTQIDETDPVWEALRSTGITGVYHLPSVPLCIREDQLPAAKPLT